MPRPVLIAHAEGEEHLAEDLAAPLEAAGYEVVHRGTLMVGDSLIVEASKVLAVEAPLVLCGTVKAMGTGWAHFLVRAARHHPDARIFAVQVEQAAFLDPLMVDEVCARYWEDPHRATEQLVASLQQYYPLETVGDEAALPSAHQAERRYRQLLLESCDIVDLANLPESDRHLAIQQLLLRRLYIPLRVSVEHRAGADVDEDVLIGLERRRSRAWHTVADTDDRDGFAERDRVAIGRRLGEARRLVVLGDPGAGKTTLTRWLATAYLLRLKRDPDLQALPGLDTLPDQDWLPILVRCRDLDVPQLVGTLDDVLQHVLRKLELSDAQVAALRGLLIQRLQNGQALLLLDGLDEIADARVRARFCRQLEQIHVAYPQAPIVATSRIVGYREMGFRIGRGFEHVTVADLAGEDKDEFARRWCAITELPIRREAAANELIAAVHSTDRIERLTGNPMLLTTLALVKRKVGKLPTRRADLYAEAVQVLLNWRSEVDEPIDHQEAIPQLQYVAYAMCDRGVQQLRADELVQLLEQMRVDYPQVHAIRHRDAESFVRLLERRTGLLVETGTVRHLGRPVPVYEFRHLTFQEYLAGLALVDGRFPGRDRSRGLAESVAPLAARIEVVDGERSVAESWCEALQLCVACCKDDDVDRVITAILTPQEGEDPELTARPRAILAALCLADEPNVSEPSARDVLRAFSAQVAPDEGRLRVRSALERAALTLAGTRWASALRTALATEFQNRPAAGVLSVGSLCGRVGSKSSLASEDEESLQARLRDQVLRLESGAEADAIDAALVIVQIAYKERARLVPGLIPALLALLQRSSASACAAAWALRWLHCTKDGTALWQPTPAELSTLRSALDRQPPGSMAIRFLSRLLNEAQDVEAVSLLLARLHDPEPIVRGPVARALAWIGDARAVPQLIELLDDEELEDGTHEAIAEGLGRIGGPQVVQALRSRFEAGNLAVARGLAQTKEPAALAAMIDWVDRALSQDEAGTARDHGDENGPEVDRVERAARQREDDICSVIDAVATIEDQAATAALRRWADDAQAWTGAFAALISQEEDDIDRWLMTHDLDIDGFAPYLTPRHLVNEAWVRHAAEALSLPPDEVRSRYEVLAQRYRLCLAWQPSSPTPPLTAQ